MTRAQRELTGKSIAGVVIFAGAAAGGGMLAKHVFALPGKVEANAAAIEAAAEDIEANRAALETLDAKLDLITETVTRIDERMKMNGGN